MGPWPRHSQSDLSFCGCCCSVHVILAKPVEYKSGAPCGPLCHHEGRAYLRTVNTVGAELSDGKIYSFKRTSSEDLDPVESIASASLICSGAQIILFLFLN